MPNQTNLFAKVLLPEGGKQKDNTDITTFILYFSTDEIIEAKRLIKEGMKKLYGTEAPDKSVSDYLMDVTKKLINE